MAKPGKTKQTKGVDIVIILLVAVLLLFGLVSLLDGYLLELTGWTQGSQAS